MSKESIMGQEEAAFFSNLIRLFQKLHPLDRVPRAGYLLRGVTEPESVAAHSHFVSLLTLLFVRQYPIMFNMEKALTMALIHDLPEAVLMDIPMPASDEYLRESKHQAELSILGALFTDFSSTYRSCLEEFEARNSPEARLVAGLDKGQMMLKILCYEKEGRGNLSEFWNNPANFRDYGIEPVSRLFDALCAAKGCPRPVAADNREFL